MKQTVNNPVQDEVTLYIYGEKQSDVNEALKDFDEVAQEKFTRKVIRDDQITSLGSEDVSTESADDTLLHCKILDKGTQFLCSYSDRLLKTKEL